MRRATSPLLITTATNRITSVVDPMGRSTTFTYGLPGYPAASSPRSRTASGAPSQMTYDTSAAAVQHHRPGGHHLELYLFPDRDHVRHLAYHALRHLDVQRHAEPERPVLCRTRRSLTLTDPLGYTDFLYFYQRRASFPTSDPPSTVPTGMSSHSTTTCITATPTTGTGMPGRHAWLPAAARSAAACRSRRTSPSRCITHWSRTDRPERHLLASDDVESVKPPLEHRTWFNYEGQTERLYSGAYYTPTARAACWTTARARSATTTYNHLRLFRPARNTDPLGRETEYSYAEQQHRPAHGEAADLSRRPSRPLRPWPLQHPPRAADLYRRGRADLETTPGTTAGQLKTVTDPNRNVTTYNYDSTGGSPPSSTPTARHGADATPTTRADRMLTRTDSEGYTLTYAYDNIDRITTITYPDGTTDLYDYTFQSGPYVGTASLELRKHTDRLGRVTTYAYDADRRLTSRHRADLGHGHAHDELRLLRGRDAQGHHRRQRQRHALGHRHRIAPRLQDLRLRHGSGADRDLYLREHHRRACTPSPTRWDR